MKKQSAKGQEQRAGNDVTPEQVKHLHMLYRSLSWTEDIYRDVLKQNFGVRSTSDLTKKQAIVFISRLLVVIEQTAPVQPLATAKQQWLVRNMWTKIDYSGGEEGDIHLNRFLEKYYHKTELKQITKQECIKLIRQIKAMTKQAEARKGKTVVLKKTTPCIYCGQEIMWVQLKDGRRVAFDIAPPSPPVGGEPGTATLIAADFHNCTKQD
jgi:hypothetical protein